MRPIRVATNTITWVEPIWHLGHVRRLWNQSRLLQAANMNQLQRQFSTMNQIHFLAISGTLFINLSSESVTRVKRKCCWLRCIIINNRNEVKIMTASHQTRSQTPVKVLNFFLIWLLNESGKLCKFPSSVRGKARAADAFWCISDSKFCHFCDKMNKSNQWDSLVVNAAFPWSAN